MQDLIGSKCWYKIYNRTSRKFDIKTGIFLSFSVHSEETSSGVVHSPCAIIQEDGTTRLNDIYVHHVAFKEGVLDD